MSGWPSRRYAIIPELHIFSRQNNLLEASQQWECHSPSLPLPRCVCVWDRGKCSAMSVYSKLQAQQFTTHVQRGKKGREKKRQARWFSSRLYINHTGTHIVLDCQEKKIVPLTALTPTSYPSSSSLYYHHLSAYLFIHLSIQPTNQPSIFLPYFTKRSGTWLHDWNTCSWTSLLILWPRLQKRGREGSEENRGNGRPVACTLESSWNCIAYFVPTAYSSGLQWPWNKIVSGDRP